MSYAIRGCEGIGDARSARAEPRSDSYRSLTGAQRSPAVHVRSTAGAHIGGPRASPCVEGNCMSLKRDYELTTYRDGVKCTRRRCCGPDSGLFEIVRWLQVRRHARFGVRVASARRTDADPALLKIQRGNSGAQVGSRVGRLESGSSPVGETNPSALQERVCARLTTRYGLDANLQQAIAPGRFGETDPSIQNVTAGTGADLMRARTLKGVVGQAGAEVAATFHHAALPLYGGKNPTRMDRPPPRHARNDHTLNRGSR